MAEVIRNKPKYKQLEDMFGGTWTFNRSGHLWECSDGRMVWAVSSCSCDGPCSSTPRYHLYGSGGDGSEEVHFNGQRLGLCMTNPL